MFCVHTTVFFFCKDKFKIETLLLIYFITFISKLRRNKNTTIANVIYFKQHITGTIERRCQTDHRCNQKTILRHKRRNQTSCKNCEGNHEKNQRNTTHNQENCYGNW